MSGKKIIIIILFTFLGFLGWGQNIQITTSLDSSKFLIGDHIHIQLQILAPKKSQLVFPIPDLSHLEEAELLDMSPIDTLTVNETSHYHQTITITVFDTGLYHFPPLILLDEDSNILAVSDSLPFYLYTLPVDTTLPIKDIKLPVRVPLTFKEIFPYILITLIAVGIILLIIWLILKYGVRKKIKIFTAPVKPKEKAHIIALRDLEALRLKKLWQEGNIKTYYSELTDIVRVYYKNRWNIDAMEMTSNEILEKSNNLTLDVELTQYIEELFTTADLVKFAKASPLPNTHSICFKHAHLFVTSTAEENSLQHEESKKI